MIFIKPIINTTPPPPPSKKRQQRDFFLLLLTVILFYLAFPSGGYGNLAWFVMIPILSVLNNVKNGRYAFMLGLLGATLGWMLSIWWVVDGLAKVTFSHSNVVIPLVFLLCLLSAIPYALASYLQAKFNWGLSLVGTLKSAVIFTVLINFIPHILPGNLAHALYQSPLQIQLLSFGGVPLLFFILHWVNALLACAIYHYRSHRQLSLRCLALAFIIVLVNLSYGKLATLDNFATSYLEPQASITVAMIQPNFNINLRDRTQWQQQAPKLSQLISQVSNNDDVDLIVLPEIPVPISYQRFTDDRLMFNNVIKDKPVLITGIAFTGQNLAESQSYFNVVELIQQQQLTGQYHKQVLVPFGEYLPFEQQYPLLRKLFPNAPYYQAGTRPPLLELNVGQKRVNLVPLICYEAVFTQLVREGVALGGDIFVNTVNDAWFGDTAGRDVHLALALYRTVEFRKPLVRVTNNGISSIFNAHGEIIPGSAITSFSAGVSITEVFIPQTKSFYQNHPKFFMILFLMLSGYAIMSGRTLSYEK